MKGVDEEVYDRFCCFVVVSYVLGVGFEIDYCWLIGMVVGKESLERRREE